ncbi:hypothetical protein GGI35DRAFT_284629 [Trichoderma velutinum]
MDSCFSFFPFLVKSISTSFFLQAGILCLFLFFFISFATITAFTLAFCHLLNSLLLGVRVDFFSFYSFYKHGMKTQKGYITRHGRSIGDLFIGNGMR